MVLGIFFVGQFLEGYVLAPKLVGESVGLHPVWLMFALFAFGYLFGFVGLLIAVPLAAVIGVLVRFALRRYLESPLYTGEPAASPVGFTVKRTEPDRDPMMLRVSSRSRCRTRRASRARISSPGRSNAAALATDRALAGLGRSRARAGRAGRRRQEPSRGDLGRDGRRAPRLRAARSARPICSARSRPARWWSRMSPAQLDERALFHLLNLVREEDGFCCSPRARRPPSWGVALPDLASRLRAMPVVTLSAPDDALLRAVLVKLFADRQLAVDETLVGYLATRIERSFAAAREAVAQLDREALRQKRPVTRALAAELLGSRAK